MCCGWVALYIVYANTRKSRQAPQAHCFAQKRVLRFIWSLAHKDHTHFTYTSSPAIEILFEIICSQYLLMRAVKREHWKSPPTFSPTQTACGVWRARFLFPLWSRLFGAKRSVECATTGRTLIWPIVRNAISPVLGRHLRLITLNLCQSTNLSRKFVSFGMTRCAHLIDTVEHIRQHHVYHRTKVWPQISAMHYIYVRMCCGKCAIGQQKQKQQQHRIIVATQC